MTRLHSLMDRASDLPKNQNGALVQRIEPGISNPIIEVRFLYAPLNNLIFNPMIYHHTKTLGDIGVLKAQVDLIQKEYIVSVPLTEHAPFDLIIYKDHLMQTVQVKARSIKNGRIEISFKSSYSDKNGVHSKDADKAKIDLYCVYCPETDKCYYFDPKKYDKSITLRIDLPKNKQIKNINLADNFLELPEI